MHLNVPRLVTAYYARRPEPSVPQQRVQFGTSGHRGSAFDKSFNESHVIALTQAIWGYRTQREPPGSLFLGIDTHARSVPAFATALEVLAANEEEVIEEVMIAGEDEYTPTPAISHTIFAYNRGSTAVRPKRRSGSGARARPWARRSSAAEITARLGRNPGEIYRELAAELGKPFYARKDAPATPAQKQVLKRLSAEQVRLAELGGSPCNACSRTYPATARHTGKP